MISPKIYKYCKDYTKIENYEKAVNDETQKWDLHHRLETHFSDGTERPINARISYKELIALNMYYSRPPEEFIFLTRKEHLVLHQSGRHWSGMSGKKHTDEAKQKLSKANRGIKRSEEVKREMSERMKGNIPWNKGIPRTDEEKRKMSESNKKYHWYTNGIENIRVIDCPKGFRPGRIRNW